MKRFKDLDITGPDELLLGIVDSISKNLSTDWHRDPEAEARLAEFGREGKDAGFAFSREAKDGDPKIGLFLAANKGGSMFPTSSRLTPGSCP